MTPVRVRGSAAALAAALFLAGCAADDREQERAAATTSAATAAAHPGVAQNSLDDLIERCVAHPEDGASCGPLLRTCVARGVSCTERLERALTLAAAEPGASAALHERRGRLYHALGRKVEQQAAYRAALAIAVAADDCRAESRAAYLLAGTVGEIDEAIGLYERSANLAERCGAPRQAHRALYRKALAQRRLGLYVKERNALERLMNSSDPGTNDQARRRLYVVLSDAQRRLGRHRAAEKAAASALELARQAGDREIEAFALEQQGVIALDRADHATARRLFVAARDAARAQGADELEQEAAALAAAALLRGGEPAAAARELQGMLPPKDATATRLAALAQLYQGEAQQRLGHLEAAMDAYDEALRLAVEIGSAELRWKVLASLAQALRQRGDVGAAHARAREAVALIEQLRDAVPGSPDRQHFLHMRSDAYAVLAATAAARDPGNLADSFAAIERAHARNLRETLSAALPLAGEPGLGLSEIQRLLRDDEVVAAYQLGDPHSVLLAFGRDWATAHELPPRAELEQQVERFRAHLVAPARRVDAAGAAGPSPAVLAAAGNELAAALLGPLRERLAQQIHLVVIPDRALHRLAFEALPLTPARDDRQPRFVGTELPVSYLPAASFVATRIDRTFRTALIVEAAGAWPEFGLPPLPGAAAEAAAIRQAYGQSGTRLLRDDDATPAALRGALSPRPDILHLASHALLSAREGPQILLHPGPGDASSGVLDAEQLVELPAAPPLAVLSACHSAGGEIVGGEGVLGLVRAFTIAGARGVVASLWPVNDRSAGQLMVRFHEHLAAGRRPSRALLAARREVAAEDPHPFHWAPFVLYGVD